MQWRFGWSTLSTQNNKGRPQPGLQEPSDFGHAGYTPTTFTRHPGAARVTYEGSTEHPNILSGVCKFSCTFKTARHVFLLKFIYKNKLQFETLVTKLWLNFFEKVALLCYEKHTADA